MPSASLDCGIFFRNPWTTFNTLQFRKIIRLEFLSIRKIINLNIYNFIFPNWTIWLDHYPSVDLGMNALSQNSASHPYGVGAVRKLTMSGSFENTVSDVFHNRDAGGGEAEAERPLSTSQKYMVICCLFSLKLFLLKNVFLY